MPNDKENYLKAELYGLIRDDPAIFEFLHNGVLDGLWYWDIEHPEQEWMNDQFWRFLGYDPEEKSALSREWQSLIHPEDLQTAISNFNAHCADPRHPYDQIVRYIHANGSTVWVRCRGMAIRDETGKAVRMLGVHVGLTELKEAEQRLTSQTDELLRMQEELRRLASCDELTGLYNRRALHEHADWVLVDAQRRSESVSMLLIDIDHFKDVNDKYGHLVGDSVLSTLSAILKESARAHDFVARFGGEELLILLPNTGIEESIKAAERVRSAIATTDQLFIPVTVSVGASTLLPAENIQHTAMAFNEMLSRADKALYEAKRSGRDRVCHFRQSKESVEWTQMHKKGTDYAQK